MWSEATLLDAVVAHLGATEPLYMLRQVEMEDRRIDAVAVVGDGRRLSIEAKISRADFSNETAAKREPTWRASHACIYLCPPGLIEPHDLPSGWGLWWAMSPAQIREVVPPRWHQPERAACDILSSSLMRRAAAVERRVRVAEGLTDPAAAVVAAEGEAARLGTLLAQQGDAVRRERRRAQDAAEQVAAVAGEQSCSCCRADIVYTRVGAWRHVDRTLDAACEARRIERERQRRMAETGAEYIAVVAPRITPASVPTDC